MVSKDEFQNALERIITMSSNVTLSLSLLLGVTKGEQTKKKQCRTNSYTAGQL